MGEVLKLEDIIISLNDLLKIKLPDNKGNFILKKNINKEMFGAIKTFRAELIYYEFKPGKKIENTVLTVVMSDKSINEDDEKRIWKQVGISLVSLILGYVTRVNWEEDYGN